MKSPCRSATRNKLMRRVRPGIFDTSAGRCPGPASVFSMDDLPAFDRPRNAISGSPSAGSSSKS